MAVTANDKDVVCLACVVFFLVPLLVVEASKRPLFIAAERTWNLQVLRTVTAFIVRATFVVDVAARLARVEEGLVAVERAVSVVRKAVWRVNCTIVASSRAILACLDRAKHP